jgi:hypothetical protein
MTPNDNIGESNLYEWRQNDDIVKGILWQLEGPSGGGILDTLAWNIESWVLP